MLALSERQHASERLLAEARLDEQQQRHAAAAVAMEEEAALLREKLAETKAKVLRVCAFTVGCCFDCVVVFALRELSVSIFGAHLFSLL